MKSKWKILIVVLAVVVLAIGVWASVSSKKGLVTVQTGTVVRQDLTSDQPGSAISAATSRTSRTVSRPRSRLKLSRV